MPRLAQLDVVVNATQLLMHLTHVRHTHIPSTVTLAHPGWPRTAKQRLHPLPAPPSHTARKMRRAWMASSCRSRSEPSMRPKVPLVSTQLPTGI
jgi:hypothetical protein